MKGCFLKFTCPLCKRIAEKVYPLERYALYLFRSFKLLDVRFIPVILRAPPQLFSFIYKTECFMS